MSKTVPGNSMCLLNTDVKMLLNPPIVQHVLMNIALKRTIVNILGEIWQIFNKRHFSLGANILYPPLKDNFRLFQSSFLKKKKKPVFTSPKMPLLI